jgi:hypothetical protein
LWLMKLPKLEPKKVEGLNRPSHWCLNVPPTISDNGKRQRLYFETKDQADTEIIRLLKRRNTFGEALQQMDQQFANEALAARRLLDGTGVSLLDAVKQFLVDHKDRNSSIPFLELFNQYLEAKPTATRSTSASCGLLANDGRSFTRC